MDSVDFVRVPVLEGGAESRAKWNILNIGRLIRKEASWSEGSEQTQSQSQTQEGKEEGRRVRSASSTGRPPTPKKGFSRPRDDTRIDVGAKSPRELFQLEARRSDRVGEFPVAQSTADAAIHLPPTEGSKTVQIVDPKETSSPNKTTERKDSITASADAEKPASRSRSSSIIASMRALGSNILAKASSQERGLARGNSADAAKLSDGVAGGSPYVSDFGHDDKLSPRKLISVGDESSGGRDSTSEVLNWDTGTGLQDEEIPRDEARLDAAPEEDHKRATAGARDDSDGGGGSGSHQGAATRATLPTSGAEQEDGKDEEEPFAFSDLLQREQKHEEQRQNQQKEKDQAAGGLLRFFPPRKREQAATAPPGSASGEKKGKPLVAERNTAPAPLLKTPLESKSGGGSTSSTSLSVLYTEQDFMALVLLDAEAAWALRDFMQKVICEENIDFILLVEEFQGESDEGKKLSLAHHIVETFLAANAPRLVNLEARLQKDVLMRYRGGAPPIVPNLFNDVFIATKLLIMNDMLPRFFASHQFNIMLGGRALLSRSLGNVKTAEALLQGLCAGSRWALSVEASEMGVVQVKESGTMVVGQINIAAPCQSVASVLADAESYIEWIPNTVDWRLEKDFGTFFRVVQFSVVTAPPGGKSNNKNAALTFVLGVFYLQRLFSRHLIAWQSVLSEDESPLGRGRERASADLSGFEIVGTSETSCNVLFIWRLDGKQQPQHQFLQHFVAGILTALASRVAQIK